MRSIFHAIGITISMTFIAAQAFATAYLESEQINLEGGLTALTLFVSADDGESLSFYVDLTLSSTEFNEVSGMSSVDISSSDHYLWDNDPNYVASRHLDSFFYTRPADSWTAQPPCSGVAHSSSGSYEACFGTPAGEGFTRLALGQLVVATGETVIFEGEIFRSGMSFMQSGAFTTVPEPSSAVLLGGGLLLLGGRRHWTERLQYLRVVSPN